jgi:hypothetical protein
MADGIAEVGTLGPESEADTVEKVTAEEEFACFTPARSFDRRR